MLTLSIARPRRRQIAALASPSIAPPLSLSADNGTAQRVKRDVARECSRECVLEVRENARRDALLYHPEQV